LLDYARFIDKWSVAHGSETKLALPFPTSHGDQQGSDILHGSVQVGTRATLSELSDEPPGVISEEIFQRAETPIYEVEPHTLKGNSDRREGAPDTSRQPAPVQGRIAKHTENIMEIQRRHSVALGHGIPVNKAGGNLDTDQEERMTDTLQQLATDQLPFLPTHHYPGELRGKLRTLTPLFQLIEARFPDEFARVD
jgi:hypothetical protein